MLMRELEEVSAQEEALISKKLGDYKVAFYTDITLFKQIGDDEPIQLTKTEAPLSISLTLPDEWINTDTSVERTCSIIRIHRDEAEVLPCELENKWLTFETDHFSTYVVVYKDVQKTTPEETTPEETTPEETTPEESTPEETIPDSGNAGTPDQGTDTGDSTQSWIWIVLMAVCVLTVGALLLKKKQMNKK